MTNKNDNERLNGLLASWADSTNESRGSEPHYEKEKEQIKDAVMSRLNSQMDLAPDSRPKKKSYWTAAAGILTLAASISVLFISNPNIVNSWFGANEVSVAIGKLQVSERERASLLFAKYSELFGKNFSGYTETKADIKLIVNDIHSIETVQPRLIKLSLVERTAGKIELVWDCNILVSANEETLRTIALIDGQEVAVELWTHQLPDGKTLIDIQCLPLATGRSSFSRQFLAEDVDAVREVGCWKDEETTFCLLQASAQVGDVI